MQLSELSLTEDIRRWIKKHESGKKCPWPGVQIEEQVISVDASVPELYRSKYEDSIQDHPFEINDLYRFDEWYRDSGQPSASDKLLCLAEELMTRMDASLKNAVDLVLFALQPSEEELKRMKQMVKAAISVAKGPCIIRVSMAKFLLRNEDKQYKRQLTQWEKENSIRQLQIVASVASDLCAEESRNGKISDKSVTSFNVLLEGINILLSSLPCDIAKIFPQIEAIAKALDGTFGGAYSLNTCRKFFEAFGFICVAESWELYVSMTKSLDFGVTPEYKIAAELRFAMAILQRTNDMDTIRFVCSRIETGASRIAPMLGDEYCVAVLKSVQTSVVRALGGFPDLGTEKVAMFVFLILKLFRALNPCSDSEWISEREEFLSEVLEESSVISYKRLRLNNRFSKEGRFDLGGWNTFNDIIFSRMTNGFDEFTVVFKTQSFPRKPKVIIVTRYLELLCEDVYKVFLAESVGEHVFPLAASGKEILILLSKYSEHTRFFENLKVYSSLIQKTASQELRAWILNASDKLDHMGSSFDGTDPLKEGVGTDGACAAASKLIEESMKLYSEFSELVMYIAPIGILSATSVDNIAHFCSIVIQACTRCCESLSQIASDKKPLPVPVESPKDDPDESKKGVAALKKFGKIIQKAVGPKSETVNLEVSKLNSSALKILVFTIQFSINKLEDMKGLVCKLWSDILSLSLHLDEAFSIPDWTTQKLEPNLVCFDNAFQTLGSLLTQSMTLIAEKVIRHDLLMNFHKKLYIPSALSTRITTSNLCFELQHALEKCVNDLLPIHRASMAEALFVAFVQDFFLILTDVRMLRTFEPEDASIAAEDLTWVMNLFTETGLISKEKIAYLARDVAELIADMGKPTALIVQLYKQNTYSRARAFNVLGNRRNDSQAAQFVRDTSV